MEVVMFNDDLVIVASGQIECESELDNETVMVRFFEFGDYTEVSTDYIYPCDTPLPMW